MGKNVTKIVVLLTCSHWLCWVLEKDWSVKGMAHDEVRNTNTETSQSISLDRLLDPWP